jgi:hypothetical protein
MLVRSKELELNLPEMVCKDASGMAMRMDREFVKVVNSIRSKELHEEDLCVHIPESLRAKADTGDYIAQESIANIWDHNIRSRERMRRCINQPPLQVKRWAVWLRSLSLYITESRIVTFITGLLKFALVLVLLFGENSEDVNSQFVAASMLIMLPVCLVQSLSTFIVVGNALSITDDDFTQTKQSLYGLCCCCFGRSVDAGSSSSGSSGGSSGGEWGESDKKATVMMNPMQPPLASQAAPIAPRTAAPALVPTPTPAPAPAPARAPARNITTGGGGGSVELSINVKMSSMIIEDIIPTHTEKSQE